MLFAWVGFLKSDQSVPQVPTGAATVVAAPAASTPAAKSVTAHPLSASCPASPCSHSCNVSLTTAHVSTNVSAMLAMATRQRISALKRCTEIVQVIVGPTCGRQVQRPPRYRSLGRNA